METIRVRVKQKDSFRFVELEVSYEQGRLTRSRTHEHPAEYDDDTVISVEAYGKDVTEAAIKILGERDLIWSSSLEVESIDELKKLGWIDEEE